MRFRTLVLSAFALAAAGYGLWHWRQGELAAARRLERWSLQQRIDATEAALARPIELGERWLSLYELPEVIAAASGLAVELDEAVLAQAGVKTDAQLPWVHGRFSVRSVLCLLLEPLELCFEIHDHRLVITHEESLAQSELRTIVYPLPQPEMAYGGADPDAWADLVQTLVAPDDWRDVGGEGHCEGVPGALVIVQTDAVHRQIRRLIDTLAQLENPPRSFEPVPIDPTYSQPPVQRILAALREPTTVTYSGQPLSAIARDLSGRLAVPIVLNQRKLPKAGVDGDVPVTIHLENISLGSALAHILDSLELTFEIRHEAIIVTTPEDTESYDHLVTVAYPVHDLVGWPDSVDDDPLLDLIQTTVAPESWSDVGGPGYLQTHQGWLPVAQTLEVHVQIERLLADLRRHLNDLRSRPVFAASEPPESEQRVRAALEQEIALRFFETPLSQAMDDLAARLNVPLVLNTKRLEEEARLAVPISCDLQSAPLHNQLRLILDPLGLTFDVRHEALLITTPEDSERSANMSIRVYDVRSLIDADLGIATANQLEETFQDLVEFESWDDVGGSGSIFEFHGLAVVAQTEDVHRRLARLVPALREHCLRRVTPPAQRAWIVKIDATSRTAWIEEALNRKVDLELREVEQETALRQLAIAHDLPLVLDWRALEEEGANMLQRISVKVHGETLASALSEILRHQNLTWEIRDEALVVTAPRNYHDQQRLAVVAYRVDDLMAGSPGDFAELAELIRAVASPGLHWRDDGGYGDLKAAGDWLLVAQTAAVHRHIELLLSDLRQALADSGGSIVHRPLTNRPSETWATHVYNLRRLVDRQRSSLDDASVKELVMTLAGRDDWSDSSGQGKAVLFRGLLVVNQSHAIHRRIEGLLTAIDEHCLADAPRADGQPWVLRVDHHPAEERIEGLLQQPVDIDFCGAARWEAVERLAARFDLPLVWDSGTIVVGRGLDEIVTYSARDQRLGHVLAWLLEPLDLSYAARDDALHVMGRRYAHQQTVIRLYHVPAGLGPEMLGWQVLRERIIELTDENLAWSDFGGPAQLEIIQPDWIAVAADWQLQEWVADLLSESRTGQTPPRERQRRELAAELDRLRRFPAPRVFAEMAYSPGSPDDPFAPAWCPPAQRLDKVQLSHD